MRGARLLGVARRQRCMCRRLGRARAQIVFRSDVSLQKTRADWGQGFSSLH